MIGKLARVVFVLTLMALPASAQDSFVTLDPPDAQSSGSEASAAPTAPCGERTISIARMQWPSAAILAEIHALLLSKELGCTVKVVAGDLAGSASAMAATGEPAVAPELWISRIAEIWNAGVAADEIRQAAPSYDNATLEGWYIPDYVAGAQPELSDAAALKTYASSLAGGKLRFISCPKDWGCALINRNLVAAEGLNDVLDVVEPADRFEMDRLIADAESRKEPFAFYYWQPNAVLSQFSFKPIDLGPYDHDAFQCLGRAVCANGKPSGFAPEPVVIAVSDWVFTDAPAVASYFQHASMPLAEMNSLLVQLGEPGASAESVAQGFVSNRQAVWKSWVGD